LNQQQRQHQSIIINVVDTNNADNTVIVTALHTSIIVVVVHTKHADNTVIVTALHPSFYHHPPPSSITHPQSIP